MSLKRTQVCFVSKVQKNFFARNCMKCSDHHSEVMLPTTTHIEVRVKSKNFFARKSMKCSDLHSKVILPTTTSRGWGGVSLYIFSLGIASNVPIITVNSFFQTPIPWGLGASSRKNFFARDCLKCSNLPSNIMLPTTAPWDGESSSRKMSLLGIV